MTKKQTPLKGHVFHPMVRWYGITENHKNLVSKTEPDQVKPLELILKHRNQGIPSPVFNGVYLGEDNEPLELYKMDAVETLQFRQDLADKIDQLSDDYHVATRKLADMQSKASNPEPKVGNINTLDPPSGAPGGSAKQKND